MQRTSVTAEHPPPRSNPRYGLAHLVRASVAALGIITAVIVSPAVQEALAGAPADHAILWVFLPLALYALLALAGMRILPATLAALATALLLTPPTLPELGEMLLGSLVNQVTIIGAIIVLGAGVGGILHATGVAQVIVTSVLHLVAGRGPRTVALGIMLACAALVIALGTLAGALAVAAPLLIPVAARLGYTRTATATLMFIGGASGLTVAPFAGSTVAVMTAANIGYGEYVLFAAAPLALIAIVIGMLRLPFVQRSSARVGDFYTDDEAVEVGASVDPAARRATRVFTVVLIVMIALGIVSGVGLLFPLIALPVLAVATGIAARQQLSAWFAALWRGMWGVAGLFLLFWLLAIMFFALERLQFFDTILVLVGPHLATSAPFVCALLVALVGWIAIPGATAAQVVLIDTIFGPLAAQAGIVGGAWATVLLFGSRADTFAPFPNINMVGPMGLAHSTNLRSLLITGWCVLVPAAAVYAGMLFALTG